MTVYGALSTMLCLNAPHVDNKLTQAAADMMLYMQAVWTWCKFTLNADVRSNSRKSHFFMMLMLIIQP